MKKNRILLFIVVMLLIPSLLYAFFLRDNAKVEVLILMYHDVREGPVSGNPWVVSTDTFYHQMETLVSGEYPIITFDDLIAFVDGEIDLPPRVILITFDDGYQSNLTLAAPILERFDISAMINVLGVQLGQSTYRHTNIPEIPFFHLEDTIPWVERGVIFIGHHSYDMHMLEYRETPETFRLGILQREDEEDEAYKYAFNQDFMRLQTKIEQIIGRPADVFAYPFGFHNEQTEQLLRELGVRVTLTSEYGINVVVRRQRESLFGLRRVNMEEHFVDDYLLIQLDMAWDSQNEEDE